jgi:hypothetical protein
MRLGRRKPRESVRDTCGTGVLQCSRLETFGQLLFLAATSSALKIGENSNMTASYEILLHFHVTCQHPSII